MSKDSFLIIEKLREVIFSKEIISDYRMNQQDFTRNRKQPFCRILLFMANLLRKSMVVEIDNFLQYMNSKMDFQRVKNFTSSAFVQKRKKIKPEVFKYLSSVITDSFYAEKQSKR